MIESTHQELTANRKFLRGLVRSSAMIVAGLIAIAVPLAYAAIAYQYESSDSRMKAQLNAEQVARFIFQYPALWEFNTVRLSEMIGSHDSDSKQNVVHRIVKNDHNVVVSRGTITTRFTMAQRVPIRVLGVELAQFEREVPLDPLLMRVALCAIGSCCLGLLAYFAFRILPLNALDGALGDLERLQSHLVQTNEELATQNQRLIVQEDALRQRSAQLANAQRLGRLGDWRYRLGDKDLWWSPEVFQILAYDPATFPGTRDAVLAAYVGDGARQVIQSQSEVMRTGSSRSVDVKVRCGDGLIRDVAVTSEAMKDDQGRTVGFYGTIQDITERRSAQEQLEKLAYYDPLTGLANRALFQREIANLLTRCGRNGVQAALLMLDLDRFKEVNDSLGHAAGDELLTKVASLISRTVDGSHFVYRLGGDEFAVIMPEFRDIAEVERLAGAVNAAITGSIQLERGEVNIDTSIGIALIPQDGSNMIDLQRNADMALYRAKEEGRGRFRFFDPALSEAAQHKFVLARDLRSAVDGNFGLTVHYQPQIDIARGQVIGFEALMRWTHPTFGNVPPSEFIPIAESSQLICDLGLWIMREAARQAKAWLDAGEPAREMAVNVSAAQIWSSDFVGDVARILDETGLPPHLLCLELTESLLADQSGGRFRGVLLALKELGVTLALDDFGTDYSSLGYLTQLPFDKLKIDRVFVDGIAESERARKLLEGIVALGRGLGMTIVAEGAEKPAEVDILRYYGCNLVQGYVFARPALAGEALATAWALEGKSHAGTELASTPSSDLSGSPKLPAVA